VVETSARLLRLLSLLEARPEWPGTDLAQRLDVTVRTLRRDVAKLRSLGYPVFAVPGVAGGYRLGAGASLPPLLLDDDEAVAIALSLRTAATQSITGVGEASVRALVKLERVLPSRLRERAAAIGHATVPLAGPGPVLDAEALTTMARACRNRERLDFGYRSREGELTARHTEPHRLVQAGYRWYLVARDIDRGEWRTFRADRIEAPRLTGVRFVPVDPPDAAAFVARAVTTAPYRYRPGFCCTPRRRRSPGRCHRASASSSPRAPAGASLSAGRTRWMPWHSTSPRWIWTTSCLSRPSWPRGSAC
jgi:predicted DNA-binding transcriptional regulator YafY